MFLREEIYLKRVSLVVLLTFMTKGGRNSDRDETLQALRQSAFNHSFVVL
jgi:hypothetical protein